MEFTQKEVLEGLAESGRHGWNLRQMTALRNEGFLPPLRRKTQQGTNKPQFVWDETDMNQIVDVYDWWSHCDGDRATLTLALWINGYNVPLHSLRNFYIHTIETYLKRITHGNTDPEAILDRVSEIVVTWMRKLKYSPGLTDQRKKMRTDQNVSMEQMEVFTETILSALFVPDEELVTKAFHSPPLDIKESQDASMDDVKNDLFIQFEDVAVILRDILTLPHLLEVIRTAKLEEWQQARKDYLSFCYALSYALIMIEKYGPSNEERSLPEEFLVEIKIKGAVWLIAPLLSTRYRGYGKWLDMFFKKMDEVFADSVVQERLLNKYEARRANKVNV